MQHSWNLRAAGSPTASSAGDHAMSPPGGYWIIDCFFSLSLVYSCL